MFVSNLFEFSPVFMCLLNLYCSGFVGALSDIIVFDYIIRGELMSKLDENETVSLNFHKKTHFELKQVS